MGVHAQFSESPIGMVGTYAQIKALVTAGTLKPGAYYRITNFQTIHIIPYTTTAPSTKALAVNGVVYNNPALWDPALTVDGVEELAILAVNTTSFSPIAYSPTYPTDIIHFDFNDILCEDGVTPRRGKIIYRKDNVNNLEAFYDWRKVRFRRWKLKPNAWVSTTTYVRKDCVMGSDGFVYFSKVAGNLNNDPASIGGGLGAPENHSSLIDHPIWERAFINDATFDQYFGIKPDNISVGLGTIKTDAADYKDFYTFNTTVTGDIGTMRGINIGPHTTYNNIIFRANYITSWNPTPYGGTVNNNTFGKGCYNMTFIGASNSGNTFGDNCYENIIQGGWSNNIMGAGWRNNLTLLCTYEYLSSSRCNIFSGDIYNCIFGNETQFNNISGTIWENTWGYQCTCNEITTQMVRSSTRSGFRDNVCKKVNTVMFGVNTQYNIIQGGQFAGGLITATIGDNFQWNTVRNINVATIGNNVQYNNIQANQANLNISDNFQYNKINGIIAAGTYFAAGTNRNTFNNDFGGGSQAIPLNLIRCIFEKTVSALQIASTAVILTDVVSLVTINTKTFPISLTNKVISAISPDGSLWAHGIDDTGQITTEKII
jgi:hypothetical protein